MRVLRIYRKVHLSIMKGRNNRSPSLALSPQRRKRTSLPSSLSQNPAPALFSNQALVSVSADDGSPAALRVAQGEGRRLKPRTAMSLSRVSCDWRSAAPIEYRPFPFVHLRAGKHMSRRAPKLPAKPQASPDNNPSRRSMQPSPPYPSPFLPSVPKIRLSSIISPPLRKQSSHSLEPWTTERRGSKALAY